MIHKQIFVKPGERGPRAMHVWARILTGVGGAIFLGLAVAAVSVWSGTAAEISIYSAAGAGLAGCAALLWATGQARSAGWASVILLLFALVGAGVISAETVGWPGLPSSGVVSADAVATRPASVLVLLFLGGALSLGCWRRSERSMLAVGFLAALVVGLASIPLLGAVIGVDSTYGWARWLDMPVALAIPYILLGTGLFLEMLDQSLRGSAAHALRLELPAGVASLVLVLLVAAAAQERERRNILEFIEVQVQSLLSEAGGRVRDISIALDRMANRWEVQGGTPEQQWRADASHYIEDHETLYAVAYADADTVLRWVESGEDAGAAVGLRLDRESDRRSAVEQARTLGRPVLTAPVDLQPGGDGFMAIAPITVDGTVQGFIVGGFRFEGLFRSMESGTQARGAFRYALYDGQRQLFLRELDAGKAYGPLEVEHVFVLGGRELRLSAVPSRKQIRELQSSMPEVALGVGLLMSALLILSVHAFHLSRRRRIQFERANVSLNEEVEHRRQTEHKLAAARERLGNILEAAGEGIYGLDARGRTTFANPAAARLIGWGDGEMIGRNQHELIHHSHADGSDYPVEECPIYATLRDGRIHDVDDEVFWSRDGRPIPVEYVSTPLHDEQGAVMGAVVVFRDVTERKEKEEVIRRRSAELAAANEDLESFAYSVSHDLRAPLRSMDGFSLALLEDYRERLDEAARDYLDRIRRASRRMEQLIDGILAISQVARSELQYERVDLSALARESFDAVKESNAACDATVEIEPGLEAEGDRRLLRIVFDNLISNACKFSAGRPGGRIEIGCEPVSGVPVFFVRDNGAGFDSRYVHKLFKPFQRLHSREQFEGTGIGLATVARAIHRHGGSVWAEGKPGAGATVFFSFQPVEKRP